MYSAISPTIDNAVAYEGWPCEARDLVERAVVTHGGRERWQSIRSVRLGVQSISGLLPFLKGYASIKGYGRKCIPPRECEIFPHNGVTLFHGYPDKQHQGRFADGGVSINNLEDGRSIAKSNRHRDTFGWFSKYRFWNALDALYFFGYAALHYHVLPFTLGMARFVRLYRQHNKATSVEVEFPKGTHTHSRRERFFFGEDGRILRHDYNAEIVGKWARACQFWEEYERVDGFLIARRRRVALRICGYSTPVSALRMEFQGPFTCR